MYHNTPTCQACNSHDLQVFYHVENVPIHSVVLIHDREEARTFPEGEIRLGFCQNCGFISNLAFDSQMQDY